MKQTAILRLPLPIQINREAVNNHMVKNKFDQNDQSIVRRRKLVVVNQHFENQIVFKNLPVVLRKSSFKNLSPLETNSPREIFQFPAIVYQTGLGGRSSVIVLNLVRQDILVF